MIEASRPISVFYSFPHRIGAARICTTAWHQVDGAASAGARMHVFAASIARSFNTDIQVTASLEVSRFRVPARIFGTYSYCALHDYLAARRLRAIGSSIDVVHVWPLGALQTLKAAKELGIPTCLERPNAHTEFAYQVVQEECARLHLKMPRGHEHEFNDQRLARENQEYELADFLLCPSDFVASTFTSRGLNPTKILRHQYGYDHTHFRPATDLSPSAEGLKVLFAGGCAPRKGLHFALEAWFRSSAHTKGVFRIAGTFIPGYAEFLKQYLDHPSVQHLGQRNDIPELMRDSDILVLPSIEEGSALVTSEARGSGCVLLVSDAAGAICKDNVNALVHHVGDVATLASQFDELHSNPARLKQLKNASISTLDELTWTTAGKRLAELYAYAASSRLSS